MKKNLQFFSVILFLALSISSGKAQEITTTVSDQTKVAVTIYNQNLALIKDSRTIDLPEGGSVLAFREVSGQMKPETALLNGKGLSVVEQNLEFDLLTPQSLLKKYVGKEVSVVKTHPTTGEETTAKARVLSVNNGVVLNIGDHIETGIPGRLIFSNVPENLRDRPTLTMLLKSSLKGKRQVELSYLTEGMNWKADYVAELNPEDDAMDISGWVTLTNRSGATYGNSLLKLVAGDVNQVRPEENTWRFKQKSEIPRAAIMNGMAEEQMFEYHLYTLDRPTTIKDNQTKQVALLQASQIPCKKEFVLKGNDYYYHSQYGEIGLKMKIGVFVEVYNTKQNNLGIPLPKGVVRVYKKDSKGSLQFVGEDRIDHTPENELILLKLGDAFDITADKKQTDFKKVMGFSRYNYVYDTSFEIILKNAKKEDVTVKVQEPIPGDWEILKESHGHVKASSNTAVWYIKVPSKGKTTLKYSARVKY